MLTSIVELSFPAKGFTGALGAGLCVNDDGRAVSLQSSKYCYLIELKVQSSNTVASIYASSRAVPDTLPASVLTKDPAPP